MNVFRVPSDTEGKLHDGLKTGLGACGCEEEISEDKGSGLGRVGKGKSQGCEHEVSCLRVPPFPSVLFSLNSEV